MKKSMYVFIFIGLSGILFAALSVAFFNILFAQGFEYESSMTKPLLLFAFFSVIPAGIAVLSLYMKKYICLICTSLGIIAGYVTGFIYYTLKGDPKMCVSTYALLIIIGMLAGMTIQLVYSLIKKSRIK